ncbi:MAG: sensor histidine kinase [Mesorhizobium sp.]|nr:sensor histidine kinase [Mesorhizobium sp.]
MLLHEVDHRVKNNLQMISSLIVMQSRSIPDENIKRSLRSMLERIEALSTVHRRLYQSDDVSEFSVSDFIRDLVTDLLAASGRAHLSSHFDLEPVVIAADKATPVALMMNELVTNALKHAFGDSTNGAAEGRISVRMRNGGDDFTIEVADNGRGMPARRTGDETFGTRLVASLARQLRAEIEWQDGAPGTRVVITLPTGKEHAGE